MDKTMGFDDIKWGRNERGGSIGDRISAEREREEAAKQAEMARAEEEEKRKKEKEQEWLRNNPGYSKYDEKQNTPHSSLTMALANPNKFKSWMK